ncbi:pseudaminic acid cytidylyltransferase [Campylobacter helveticus]|uniref:Pseudaminic acid cytidylyltransferase n=1 Tax=Campylobacter helveticus TaxID=28898 RepID=A0AAX2UJD1_9BACT|nr:pseudaminic acid cytidylyltransferase [Campylobacter helveticus]ARE81115.1 CMP-pseudaminic acid synthetase [Campylobacter helveticus]MCR2054134.1 pseudaminic acid cytidylyltransferase [Campylobacter helveticus]MCR2055959.1 pseudaminic acid cytidylyltransferase [Campylobacter helveticus]MCR2059567.1 pseudaminic acid cytidylyltransferase [Campylobacter helveticus]MCR2061276.1 pseudaminic acid cytidylyltransferase [Campylobacter helveticus]
MKNLCIIPARGGSKRIPRKNIVDFCGKPLIAYSIKNALNSGVFESVVVSSDDEEILQVASNFGAKVLLRERELSDDYSSSTKVIQSVIQKIGKDYENICCLYATAPLINAKILQNAYEEFAKGAFKFLLSATEFDYPIQRAFCLDDEKRIHMFDESKYFARSQDLKKAYHDAGAFYFGKKTAWLEEDFIMFKPHSGVYLLPRNLVCDIDMPQDLEFAKRLFILNKDFNENSHSCG